MPNTNAIRSYLKPSAFGRTKLRRYRQRGPDALLENEVMAGPVVIIDQDNRAQVTGEFGEAIMTQLPVGSPVAARWWGTRYTNGEWMFYTSDEFHDKWVVY